MGWSGPNKRTGWRPSERPETIQNRLIRVVRNIMEIVPGGVLRSGKLVFGQGSGWMLSVRDDGTGMVDIGDDENYMRFDGDAFTWHTPLTYLTDSGNLSAVNVKIRVEQSYDRPSRIEWMNGGTTPCAQIVTTQVLADCETHTYLSNRPLPDYENTAIALITQAGEDGVGRITLEAHGDDGLQLAYLDIEANPDGATAILSADTATIAVDSLILAHGYLQMDEISEPAAPVSNRAYIYLRDNGAGKTQLCVRFAAGAAQVLATEP